MRLKLDENSYLDVKKDKLKNKAKLSVKTKSGLKSIIVTSELDEEQVTRLISELISIKAELYGEL